jgi:hypothetical protein
MAFWALSLVAAPGLLRGQATPVLVWQNPAPIEFPAPLSGVQLNATALAGQPVTVPLAGSYNVDGITTSGFPVTQGFDSDGDTYPAELLGSSVSWLGVTFPLGAANAPNAVSGGTIPLPTGSFGALLMLGALVNNQTPPTATFEVKYTDGTSATITQSMSDWVFPRNFSGESVVECLPYRYTSAHSMELDAVCVYGYAIALDPAKTVQNLIMPNDRDIVMLAFALVPAEVPGTIQYDPAAGTVLTSGNYELHASFAPANASAWAAVKATVPIQVNAPSEPVKPSIAWAMPQRIVYGTALGPVQLDATASVGVAPNPIALEAEVHTGAIAQDGFGTTLAGFDGQGNEYSSEQLGSTLSFAGGTFPLGASRVPDAVTSTTIPLPQGSFDTVYLLGAANGAQPAQTFTVNYSDGSSSTATQSVSDWRTPGNYSGETIVATTSYAVTNSGGQLAGTYYVYGYEIPVDTAKTAASLTLPQNLNVMVLAAGVGMSSATVPEPGTFVYTPDAGTVLPAGVQPLNVVFTPMDSTEIAMGSAANSIDVGKAPVTLSVSTPVSTVPQGQSVTLTAKVKSTTIGVPTGTVTFLCNGAPLGPATLSQGMASLTTAALPQGTDAISVSYSGDVDFLSASAAGPKIDVLVSDFTLTAPDGTTLTVPWGGKGTLLLHVAPLGLVYESNLSITASALGTPFGSASISPEIVGSLAGPHDVGVTVKLDSLSRLAEPEALHDGQMLAGLGALLLLPLSASRRLRRRLGGAALLMVVAAGLGIGLSGCGSGYVSASSPLTVTATDGTHTHSVTLTVRFVAPQ